MGRKFGHIVTEETRKKISLSQKGHIPWNKNLKMSGEFRKKVSDGHKGQIPWNTNLSKEMQPNWQGLNSHTKEYKRKKRIERSRRNGVKERGETKNPGNFPKNHIPWNKGQKCSLEVKQKISKTLKERGCSKQEKNPRWKGGKPKCIICGKILSSYDAKKCSGCYRKAIIASKASFKKGQFAGSKHYNWKGGISREPYGFDFNKELKELIRKRDLYKCRKCGAPQEEFVKRLPIHHIDYDKKNNNPKNLITLCQKCNPEVNYSRDYWTDYFMKEVFK